MPDSAFIKNLKKWFWGFFLGQAVVTVGAFLIFTGNLQRAVLEHDNSIKSINLKLDAKADLQAVMRIKLDNDRVQNMILEDVKYIRMRIDQHMDSKK